MVTKNVTITGNYLPSRSRTGQTPSEGAPHLHHQLTIWAHCGTIELIFWIYQFSMSMPECCILNWLHMHGFL